MNSSMGFAAAAYRQAAASVHPTVAVVKLYDATLLAILQAVRAREQKQIEESFNKVMRAATILRGLDQALDYEKGGAVAEQLHRVYRSYILSLHVNFGKPDVQKRYRKLYDSLIGLRDAWAKIAGMDPHQEASEAGHPHVAAGVAPAASVMTPPPVPAFDSSLFLGLMADQTPTGRQAPSITPPVVRRARRSALQQPAAR